MLKKKVLISLSTVAVMVIFLTSVSMAATGGTSYYDYIAKNTGKSVNELREIEKEYGDLGEYFNMAVPDEVVKNSVSKEKTTLKDKKINSNSDIDQIPGYYEAFSKYTGLPINDLKEIYKQNGELGEYLGLPIDVEKLKSSSTNQILSSDSGGGDVTPMTPDQWTTMKNAADKGDTLITKDQWWGPINHGHAAIVYESYSKTVEHTGDGLSAVYDINKYANAYTLRDYYPSGTTGDTRRAAADYAKNYLVNKQYDAIADINSSTYVNCATLVWKAYKYKGITLDYFPIYMSSGGYPVKICDTVFPSTIVEDTSMTLWEGVNWPGGDNEW